jgi:hypothetical protein
MRHITNFSSLLIHLLLSLSFSILLLHNEKQICLDIRDISLPIAFRQLRYLFRLEAITDLDYQKLLVGSRLPVNRRHATPPPRYEWISGVAGWVTDQGGGGGSQ